jgi:hypothetical protein
MSHPPDGQMQICGTETQLYEANVAVCVKCADDPERRRKFLEAQTLQFPDPPTGQDLDDPTDPSSAR